MNTNQIGKTQENSGWNSNDIVISQVEILDFNHVVESSLFDDSHLIVGQLEEGKASQRNERFRVDGFNHVSGQSKLLQRWQVVKRTGTDR